MSIIHQYFHQSIAIKFGRSHHLQHTTSRVRWVPGSVLLPLDDATQVTSRMAQASGGGLALIHLLYRFYYVQQSSGLEKLKSHVF